MPLHPAEGQMGVKELGKVCPYVRLQGQPGESRAEGSQGLRLFTQNTGPCGPERSCIRAETCPMFAVPGPSPCEGARHAADQ